MVCCLIGLLVAIAVLPSVAGAQERHVYAGGAVARVSQTHSDAEPLGGTTSGGSVVVGTWVSPRLGLEGEATFGGRSSWAYSYRPAIAIPRADVVPSRRDTYLVFQLRARMGVLEPVIGLGDALGRISRHATINGSPYFDDAAWHHGLAAVGGLDAAIRISSRFSVVPTFRALAVARGDSERPLRKDTRTGSVAFRYGVGARVLF